MSRPLRALCAVAATALIGAVAHAQESAPSVPQKPAPDASRLPAIEVIGAGTTKPAKKRRAVRAAPASSDGQPDGRSVPLPEIEVSETRNRLDAGPPPLKQRYQLPQTAASVSGEKVEQTTNIVDSADAVKYLPSLFVRKRNYGDNQQVLATRSWGPSYSARSMVYADDILLSVYLNNSNSSYAAVPRWGLVAPEEIQRVDFLYGPFAAAYPGNSMGGVLTFTTRMPDKPEFSFKQSESLQTFSFYDTKDTYRTDQSSLAVGNRFNALSFFVSGNFQNSYSQPLTWITSSTIPAGTSGTIRQTDRTGAPANVVGAGGILHTEMANLKAKVALDVTDWLRATYIVGLWSNEQNSSVQTYLRDAAGNPTYGNVSGFASNTYSLTQTDLANALSLKSDTKGAFDFDVAISRVDFLDERQRTPFGVTAGMGLTSVGRIAQMNGTNWTFADAKGILRLGGPLGPHEVSFGVHGDYNVLDNPTYRSTDWRSGSTTGELYTNAQGKTQTVALWVQDAWRFAPQFKLTTGGRWESWKAFDGFNLTTTTSGAGAITATSTVNQPEMSATRFSPKASLSWEPSRNWAVTGSFGVANRFPTVGELYQTGTGAGGILVNGNPDLKPETAYSWELAIERQLVGGKVRLSFFVDDTHDAIFSQNSYQPATNTTTSYILNIEHIQNRGIELAWQKDNVLVERLEMFGSVTFADSEIISDPNFVGAGTAQGKRVPYIPQWRSTLGATWRPTDAWAYTLVGRYQSKMYATLNNIDVVPNVYQAFDPFVVVDARAQYKLSEHSSLSVGIDNLFNEKYTLFHPFPQRTFVAQGRVAF